MFFLHFVVHGSLPRIRSVPIVETCWRQRRKRLFQNMQPLRVFFIAGADMILMPEDFDAARNAVLDAVNNGIIPELRLDESLRRIVAVKKIYHKRFVA